MSQTKIKILKTANKPSLYIHIPFCSHLCHYCDFTKFFYQKKWIQSYLKTLKDEIASFNQTSFLTLYVGGGTPTSLSEEELEQLLKIIEPYVNQPLEYTFECNIESTTANKLILLKNYGVNRLSFGVQSTHDQRLEEIGRKHHYSQVVDIVEQARRIGFDRMSVDLIYGLPNQTLEELAIDVENILRLETSHISTYSLTIHPHTKAYIDKWPLLSDDKSREMYDLILTRLREAGYERYEISNFARPGHESVHNHVYWFSRPFYGAGYGASGYLINDKRHYRYRNIGHFTQYLTGHVEKEDEWLDENKVELEYLMNNLRLKNGFAREEYKDKFAVDFADRYAAKLPFLINSGLLNLTDTLVYCSDEGLIKLDYILFKLM